MFIDTHCHLNIMAAKKEGEPLTDQHISFIGQIIDTATANGVSTIINVGTSLPETINSIRIAQQFANVWASAGIHPTDCNEEWYEDFKELSKLISGKIVAIGETGLDFYHKPFHKQRQIDAFKAHIELSLEHNLPLIVHTRESAQETLEVLEQYRKQARGVFHCFMQSADIAQVVFDWGWCIGIDAPITYPKNEWLRQIVKTMPLEYLVLETDSPFLPPQNRRGKQNSPIFMPEWAQVIADLRGISLEELAQKTTQNAQKLFGL